MSSTISALTAVQLSAASYAGNPVPSGWIALNTYYSNGQILTGGPQNLASAPDSLTVFENTTTSQIVVGFKGSNNNTNLDSDIRDGGSADWNRLFPALQQAMADVNSTQYSNMGFLFVGDSLGGGMAQTAAVLYDRNAYDISSLPISGAGQAAIAAEYGSVSAGISQWSANNVAFGLHLDGDPATLAFNSVLGSFGPGSASLYVNTTTTVIDNPYYGGELLSLDAPFAPDLLVGSQEAAVGAYSIYQSHMIMNISGILQGNYGFSVTHSAISSPDDLSTAEQTVVDAMGAEFTNIFQETLTWTDGSNIYFGLNAANPIFTFSPVSASTDGFALTLQQSGGQQETWSVTPGLPSNPQSPLTLQSDQVAVLLGQVIPGTPITTAESIDAEAPETITISGTDLNLSFGAGSVVLAGPDVAVSTGPGSVVYAASGDSITTNQSTVNWLDSATSGVINGYDDFVGVVAQDGAQIGSALGQLIGGNNPFAQVAASTVLGALGATLSEFRNVDLSQVLLTNGDAVATAFGDNLGASFGLR
jgi:hypothetical protein